MTEIQRGGRQGLRDRRRILSRKQRLKVGQGQSPWAIGSPIRNPLNMARDGAPHLEAVWVGPGAAHSSAHQAHPQGLSPLLPGFSFVPLQTWSKVLAISGSLTMGLTLLGCVGALKELRSLLGLVSAPLPP